MQILDFLTTHPGRGFTLSELARQLRMSKTTAHSILMTLTSGALVVRNPDTFEYRLGYALVPMGSVAERNLPALTYAKREAEQLAEQHDAESMIVVVADEDLLIVHHAGVGDPTGTTFQEGQRQPFAPPLGTLVVAWANSEAFEAWLDRLGPDLPQAERQRYRVAVEAVRRRGYAIGIRVPRLHELQDLYLRADLHTPQGRHELSLALATLAHDTYLPAGDDIPPDAEISGVTAPVFGPDAKLLFMIAVVGTDYRVRDIPTLSRSVVRAAGRVMAATDGRHPTGAQAPPGPAR